MLKSRQIFAVIMAVLGIAAVSQAQCPGYTAPPGHNVNLACAIATSAPSQANSTAAASGSLSYAVGSTMATQLSQLPIATAVSGAGLVFNSQLGVFEASKDNGPILTQRGDTIGRHKLFLSFTYQRFSFDEVDGIDLKKDLQIVNKLNVSSSTTLYSVNPLRVDFRIDQFVGVATFGLTKRVDVSFIVPFSQASLQSQRKAGATLYTVTNGTLQTPSALSTNDFAGSATGIGDIIAGVKANIFKSASEKTSIAIGGQLRFPTGDANNYLGTGAYGIKPYIVISHRGRVTPNVSFGYQWNGVSPLNVGTTGNSLNLPSSFMYSGGVDIQLAKRVSFAGELLGQAVINGPRLVSSTVSVASGTSPNTVATSNGSYAMHNASFGIKLNPFKGFLFTGSALVKLDNAGLRANVVPMIGMAYRF
jgi:Putative MetA-pathway of phenol degradation